MQRDYRLYVDDIIDAIRKIEEYTKGMSFGDFEGNSLVADAVTRNLEIIGEAVKNIPEEVKKKHPEVEWKKIAGLRDIITHGYFGIDLKIVWDIVENKVTELKDNISKIKDS